LFKKNNNSLKAVLPQVTCGKRFLIVSVTGNADVEGINFKG
jgi:hypothetical protein